MIKIISSETDSLFSSTTLVDSCGHLFRSCKSHFGPCHGSLLFSNSLADIPSVGTSAELFLRIY